MDNAKVPDDTFDAPADATIKSCLTSGSLKSFFLFAGAGSGKTRSLIEALKEARSARGRSFVCTEEKSVSSLTPIMPVMKSNGE